MFKSVEPVRCLRFEFLKSFNHQPFRLIDAKRFNVELKDVFAFAEVDFGSELLVSNTLSASDAFRLVSNLCLDFALAKVLQFKRTTAYFDEFTCVLALNWLQNFDIRHESVVGGAHRGPLGVCFTDSLLTNEFHFNLLARSEFCN